MLVVALCTLNVAFTAAFATFSVISTSYALVPIVLLEHILYTGRYV